MYVCMYVCLYVYISRDMYIVNNVVKKCHLTYLFPVWGVVKPLHDLPIDIGTHRLDMCCLLPSRSPMSMYECVMTHNVGRKKHDNRFGCNSCSVQC